ncbi:MAG: hypothetical protein ACI4GB_04290 [Acutalibacteraceae bacterium]
MDRFVYIKSIDIYDDTVFTKERTLEWENHLLDSYEDVFLGIKAKIDPVSPVKFNINKALLDETIIDAVIGMRKITDSSFNSVEDPNSFKIAAYLAYWWLRHKPASVYYPDNFELNDVKIVGCPLGSDEEYERQKLIWQLKHVNELVAVQTVFTYIFDFDVVLCDKRSCRRIKNAEKERFCFENFEEMKDVLFKKLTYYFAYRPITPKTIEHILEGYTFHPAWGLTGPQWNLDD